LRLERAAARVADFSDEDGGLSKTELVTLDLEVVLCIRNVLVNAEFGLGSALVLDFDFKVERWDAFKGDGNDFFASCFTRAVAVGLSGLVELGAGAGMDYLADGNRREVLFGVVVLDIRQCQEGVLVCARLRSICSNRCGAASRMKFFVPIEDISAFPVLEVLSVGNIEGCVA